MITFPNLYSFDLDFSLSLTLKYVYIVTRLATVQRFRLVIGHIGLLQIVTTIKYIRFTSLRGLQLSVPGVVLYILQQRGLLRLRAHSSSEEQLSHNNLRLGVTCLHQSWLSVSVPV